jgi:hypothetical protein
MKYASSNLEISVAEVPFQHWLGKMRSPNVVQNSPIFMELSGFTRLHRLLAENLQADFVKGANMRRQGDLQRIRSAKILRDESH